MTFERGDTVEHPEHGQGRYVGPDPLLPDLALVAFAGTDHYDFGYDPTGAQHPPAFHLHTVPAAQLTAVDADTDTCD